MHKRWHRRSCWDSATAAGCADFVMHALRSRIHGQAEVQLFGVESIWNRLQGRVEPGHEGNDGSHPGGDRSLALGGGT